jgi:hypothetical protein
MAIPTVLVSTWSDGLFVVTARPNARSLRTSRSEDSHPTRVAVLLFIVGGHSLCRRTPDGAISTLATSELDLTCCMAVGDVIYVGTDDARLLRFNASGALEVVRGFDVVAGRDTWYAGSIVVDGRLVGPPLGVRSMTKTSDGSVLLVTFTSAAFHGR